MIWCGSVVGTEDGRCGKVELHMHEQSTLRMNVHIPACAHFDTYMS